jgi:hypothetical protein
VEYCNRDKCYGRCQRDEREKIKNIVRNLVVGLISMCVSARTQSRVGWAGIDIPVLNVLPDQGLKVLDCVLGCGTVSKMGV